MSQKIIYFLNFYRKHSGAKSWKTIAKLFWCCMIVHMVTLICIVWRSVSNSYCTIRFLYLAKSWLALVVMQGMAENHVWLEPRYVESLTPTSRYNWLFIFQEAAVMIVTVSLIVGGILAVLGYFAKKYGKCKWLAACISSRDQVDVERQKSQRKKWRIVAIIFVRHQKVLQMKTKTIVIHILELK